MRFIGSKTLLLDHIRAVAEEKAPDARSFCDIFSGTAAVARHFKQWYEVYSNDLLYFSYVLQRATIENDSVPEFGRLKESWASRTRWSTLTEKRPGTWRTWCRRDVSFRIRTPQQAAVCI